MSETSYLLVDLDEFTDYSIWLVAINANGIGDATHEITVKTFSASPTASPQNITAEPVSSQVNYTKRLYLNFTVPISPRLFQGGICLGCTLDLKCRIYLIFKMFLQLDLKCRIYLLFNIKNAFATIICLFACSWIN